MSQPLYKDHTGVVRFKNNLIVRALLEFSQKRGFGLNELSLREEEFPQADWEQFFQLIGYSLAGYHELSLVSDEAALAASDEARKTLGIPGGGCRDFGCSIHCGVRRRP